MKLNLKTENKLKKEVIKFLKNGRLNWDIPHTLASVYWMKKLLETETGNEKILVTTMYLHDIGYSRINDPLLDYESTHEAMIDHMKNGVKIAKPILRKLKLPKNESLEIVHLIAVHDNIKSIKTANEILVFEANSLGQIDIERAISNLDEKNRKKFLNRYEKNRLPNFRTKTGKKLVKKLFFKAKNYYNV